MNTIKFPRFKKSFLKNAIRELSDAGNGDDPKYKYELTYGRTGDRYCYTFLFRLQNGYGVKEIFSDCHECSPEDIVREYKDFIKWAKRTHKQWEKTTSAA